MNTRLMPIFVFAWLLCAGSIFPAAELYAQRTAPATPRVITYDVPPEVPAASVPVTIPPVTREVPQNEPQPAPPEPEPPKLEPADILLATIEKEASLLPLPGSLPEVLPATPGENSPANDLWNAISPATSENVGTSVSLVLLLAVLTLAPAILLMVTCFVRIVVVLGILRQGLAAQGLPSTQVITALALFMTFFIMYPVGKEVYHISLEPYQNQQITGAVAWERGVRPLREFMFKQIVLTKNTDDIWLFWSYSATPPQEDSIERYTQDDIPLEVLVPAFMLSELKTAFLIGVQLLLPMLVIDLLVSTVLVSLGMYMLPPMMISLPLKLLVFVMADGWRLVVEMLLRSFTG